MNLSLCHLFHHKSYTDWPGIEPDLGGNEHEMEPYKDTMWKETVHRTGSGSGLKGEFHINSFEPLGYKTTRFVY